jgi:hypothetical protein
LQVASGQLILFPAIEKKGNVGERKRKKERKREERRGNK